MYQDYLKEVDIVKGKSFLKEDWVVFDDCLLRVVFFDISSEFAYIVGYSEKRREYILKKFHTKDGKLVWEKRLLNGGYGTPVIHGDIIYMLSEFDTVIGIDKNDGSIVFSVKLGSRIRTSLNVIDDLIWLGCAGKVVALNSKGQLIRQFKIENSFTYGVILKYQDSILVTGTKFFFDKEEAEKVLWVIGYDTGDVMLEVPLGKGSIISSDTSGAWLEGDYVYLTNNNIIYKFNLISGEFSWRVSVEGDCDRETVVIDDERLYYTTLSGIAGCLSVVDGSIIWKQSFGEKLIVSPISILGDSALVLADARVYCLDKYTGKCLSRYPVGHTPYSMCSINEDEIYIGGGEPPINGSLIKFKAAENISSGKLNDYFYLNNDLDSDSLELTVVTAKPWLRLELLSGRISKKEVTILERITPNVFSCNVELESRNVEGKYVLPLRLINDDDLQLTNIVVELVRGEPLPKKHVINEFVKSVRQDGYFDSGAALSEMIFKAYNKDISQKEFRKIIDYVKEKSEWDDADFQTWRLILKRVLSSPAKNLEEFKLLENDK
ncbi:PQQ-binding-like beta-propeller repeat protein [Streptococcus equinus]|uniref:outer membrane protein assembly factor BamB family protein n=1 Tax=Streptococcus equinus TaxID=1335 RepID=UPI0015F5F522|nr:PQQ-binding-like beta-propeller repeat protein [Streptococcus equinus]QMS96997.1 PQQ-like beta-propeller repeat protein [Streptococcus equinus]